MSALDYLPRRAKGLPPGQREVKRMPRFSDEPLRWAPVPGPIELKLSVEGTAVASLGAADLEGYEQVEQISDSHCVTTWSYKNLQWGGVRLAQVLEEVLADTLGDQLPQFASVHAADSRSSIVATVDLLQPDVLLATHLDGEPLTRRHGAPLRLVCPRQYGYKSAKHLIAINFSHEQPESTLGPKEHLRGRVAEEERHSSLPNWSVRVPYRLTVVPTALAAERGLRNSPEV